MTPERNDQESEAELIRRIAGAERDEDRQRLLRSLTDRLTPGLVASAAKSARTGPGMEAETGCRVLGIFARRGSAELRRKACDLLVQIANTSSVSGKILVCALNELSDSCTTAAAKQTLLEFRRHNSRDVRRAVAAGLPVIFGAQPTDEAIQSLIELSHDDDSSVRDWATTGLGEQLIQSAEGGAVDSDEIRNALFARVNDPDDDARSEALLGLALRQDERAIEPLLRELRADRVGSIVVRAAESLGSPRLLEPLVELHDWWDLDPELLDRAIEACKR